VLRLYAWAKLAGSRGISRYVWRHGGRACEDTWGTSEMSLLFTGTPIPENMPPLAGLTFLMSISGAPCRPACVERSPRSFARRMRGFSAYVAVGVCGSKAPHPGPLPARAGEGEDRRSSAVQWLRMIVRRYSSAVSPLARASPARFFIAAVIRIPSTALILPKPALPITNPPVLGVFAVGFFCLAMASK
jgi:hypothetical protein